MLLCDSTTTIRVSYSLLDQGQVGWQVRLLLVVKSIVVMLINVVSSGYSFVIRRLAGRLVR